MNEYVVFFFAWILIVPSFAQDNETISPKECFDLTTNKDIPGFCQALAPSIQFNQFSLEIGQEGNVCIAQPKWMDTPLNDPTLLECLNLKLEWKSHEKIDIDQDSFKATIASDATLTLAFTNFQGETQIIEQNCKKKLLLKNLEIILSDTLNSLTSEEEENNTPKEPPEFAYCEWSFVDQDGEELSIEKITANGYKIEFEENEDDINCNKNGSKKYDCTHEIDESGHSVTLAITDSMGSEKKTSTCKIPSQNELLQGYQEIQNYSTPIQVRPVIPPRPIRFNFGGPILSPGVF